MRRKPNWATLASLCPSFRKALCLEQEGKAWSGQQMCFWKLTSECHWHIAGLVGIFIRSPQYMQLYLDAVGTLVFFKEALQWKVVFKTSPGHECSHLMVPWQLSCVYVSVCVCVCVLCEVRSRKFSPLCYKKIKWGLKAWLAWVLMCWEFSRAACSVHMCLCYLCAHMSPNSPGWDTFPGSLQEPPLSPFDPQGYRTVWLVVPLSLLLLATPLSYCSKISASGKIHPGLCMVFQTVYV